MKKAFFLMGVLTLAGCASNSQKIQALAATVSLDNRTAATVSAKDMTFSDVPMKPMTASQSAARMN